jgi:hypothetical protein
VIRKYEQYDADDPYVWNAYVEHDGWEEDAWFATWEAALDWAYWRVM